MAQLNTNNFEKASKDNTNQVEELVQKALFKVKDIIGEEVYKHIYPSGSNPGKFYGTAKVHKIQPNDKYIHEKLPLPP